MPDRREFVKALVSVPVLGLFCPKALIGDPAGGFYAPVPDDLEPYVQWYDTIRSASGSVTRASCAAIWAPHGSDVGQVQMFGGACVISDLEQRSSRASPTLDASKRENLLRSLRACLREHHEPGWFLVTETVQTAEPKGDNEDGEPYFYQTVTRWRRVGYVRWLKPSDLSKAVLRVA